MVVGEFAEAVDLVVVGAGPGGYMAALRGAERGREVLLVDRDGPGGVGGACLHRGCVPSKALVEVARAAHAPIRLAGMGLSLAPARFDMDRFQTWKHELIQRLMADVDRLLGVAGVRLLPGTLRLTRPDQAVIATPEGRARFVEFRDIIFATGSRPARLRHLPRDGEKVLDSADVLALRTLPRTVVVVGVDYIGVELGVALAKLGSRVTMLEAGDRLLPALDRSLSRAVTRQLPGLGITLCTDAEVVSYDGQCLEIRTREGPSSIMAEIVVVCAGQGAATDDLGLERAGVVVPNCGLLPVHPDRRLTDHIAAIGDVTPGPPVAAKARAEAAVAVDALGGHPARFEPAAIPIVVYADPEIATTGLTADQARAQGMEVGSHTVPLRASVRAAIAGYQDGFVRVVVDRETDAIVGVQVAGPNAAEVIAAGVLAIELAASSLDVALTLYPHPTVGELEVQACLSLSRSWPSHGGSARS